MLREKRSENQPQENFLDRMAQRLGGTANAATIFAAPIECGEVTVIPVAKAMYGFGGGDGTKQNEQGSGGGGGVRVIPVGYIEIRNGSGGSGHYHGGEGIHREMLLLEDLDISLVTSRRGDNHPYGMSGGKPGTSGENYRVDVDGQVHLLPATCQIKLKAGERIGLKTPGGGGYGHAT